jgi:hypothetical protein
MQFDLGAQKISYYTQAFFRGVDKKKILVKLTRGPQNDSRGHKNSVEFILNVWIENGPIL